MVLTDAEIFYTFNNADNTGSNPNDVSGNGNNGINNGATTGATGLIDEAYSYDGSNDYVDTTKVLYGTINQPFTINMFVNLSAVKNHGFCISFDQSVTLNGVWMAHFNSTGLFIMRTANNGTQYNADFTISQSLNSWFMVSLVFDGSTLKSYHNAVEKNSVSAQANLTLECLWIGAYRKDIIQNMLQGRADLFGAYKRALSPTELGDLWNGGAGFNPYSSTPKKNSLLFANDL